MPVEQGQKRGGLGRRTLAILLAIVVGLALLYLFLSRSELRVMRVSGDAVKLSGSELEQSRSLTVPSLPTTARPTNVIIVIADGLGFAHLSAARAALHGMGGETVWDRFTTTGWHQPHAADGFLVDSAASATALATGVPTALDRVGVDSQGAPVRNLFERGSALGYRTGIVTDSYVWDATPAAFAAHTSSRDDAASILEQLAESSLEILVGELEDVGEGEVPERKPTLEMLERRFRIFGPDSRSAEDFLRQGARGGPVAAIFDEDQVNDLRSDPPLPPLVLTALERLASDGRPFLLLVESEEVDSASHRADFERALRGMEVIEAVLEEVLDFAERNGETMVLFTSDHETGGLVLSVQDPTNSRMKALWSTRHHSGVVVPVLAIGPGAEAFGGPHASWEVGRLLAQMLVDRAPATPTAEKP